MDNSPEIPSKAKIEAELQDAEKKIKALKSIQEDVLARGAQVVVDRRLKVGEEMTRPCCPHAQSQKLYEEWERLFFDPLFVEWWQLDLQIMKVKKQRRSLMWDLEDLNAAEASSSAPVPEIFLSEANPPLVRNTAKSGFRGIADSSISQTFGAVVSALWQGFEGKRVNPSDQKGEKNY